MCGAGKPGSIWKFTLIKFPNKQTVKPPSLQGLTGEGSAIELDMGPPMNADAIRNYKTIKEILERLMKLCVSDVGGEKKPKKHEQRLLRNMGAHAVVLELLQIPYEKVNWESGEELISLLSDLIVTMKYQWIEINYSDIDVITIFQSFHLLIINEIFSAI